MADETNENVTTESAATENKTSAPEMFMSPIDWYRQKRTKWEIACLAAAIQNWDPTCADELTVSETEYNAAITLAEMKIIDCRAVAAKLPDSTAQRRVFVLRHPDLMHAIVAYKPNVPESNAHLRASMDPESPPEMRQAATADGLWSRVLYPASATAERQRLMDEYPIAFGSTYPVAYLRALGLSQDDVRKKR